MAPKPLLTLSATPPAALFAELGTSQSEGAVLGFTVRHIGPCSGTVEVNESITYSDTEGNVVSFPSPELDVSGSPLSICNARNFKARFIAHYIDSDFDCCDLML